MPLMRGIRRTLAFVNFQFLCPRGTIEFFRKVWKTYLAEIFARTWFPYRVTLPAAGSALVEFVERVDLNSRVRSE